MSRPLACMVVAWLAVGCAADDAFDNDPNDPTHWRDGERPHSVGRACSLVRVPDAGLTETVIYSEAHAEECDGLMCMAYRVEGDPGDPYVRDQVFCTCRCSPAHGDPSVPLCRCGAGMHCRDDLYRLPGSAFAGGYCVPCITDDDERNLDPHVFVRCDA